VAKTSGLINSVGFPFQWAIPFYLLFSFTFFAFSIPPTRRVCSCQRAFANAGQNFRRVLKIAKPKSMSSAQKSKQIFEKTSSFFLDYYAKFCYIVPVPNPPTAI
jgi:hypothetical protein